MGGRDEWVAQALEVLCVAMLSQSRQSANTITHLKVGDERRVEQVSWYETRQLSEHVLRELIQRKNAQSDDDDYMERGSVHLSHWLRSTHCNLLSLRLEWYKDKDDEGGGQLTSLGHIAQALQGNTTLTTLRIDSCALCTSTAHEIAALLSVNTILQRVQFHSVRFTHEGRAHVRRALCGAHSGTTSKAPGTIPFGSGALTALSLEHTELGEVAWLGDMLAHNVSLQALNLRNSGLRDGAGRDLAEGLRRSNSSLKVLDYKYRGLPVQDMQHIFSALENHATLEIFQCGDSLVSRISEGVEDIACALARMISTNRSLHTLEYPSAPFSATQWSKHIVPALLESHTQSH